VTLIPVLAEHASGLAALHAAAFDAPWSAQAIGEVLAGPGAFGLAVRDETGLTGFILMRAIAGEAEILTLAVAPQHRRTGLGRALLAAGLARAALAGAEQAFLEVAHDNTVAIALYSSAGFVEAGRRRGYYGRADGASADALILSRALAS
jgi:ribosomal-protein-alanine N-acetyltransferase